MSDSDDTDILLLIPPDFFAVHQSDSEDSIRGERHVRGEVVNDLISQVCDLENRLSAIESRENLSISSSQKRSPSKESISRKEVMSQQTWHNLNTSTPHSRCSRATSLPPTPSGSVVSGGPIFHRANSYPSPSKSTTASSDNGNSPFARSSVSRNGPGARSSNGESQNDVRIRNYVSQFPSRREAKQFGKSRNSEIIKEIDHFFDSMRGRHESRPRDVTSSPATSTTASAQISQLPLNEVDRLLEKMDAEQQEMEAKLTARERQFGLPAGEEAAKAIHIKSFPGDSISSVPDLNLGVRKLWDDSKSTKPPTQTSGLRATNGFQNDKQGDGIIEEPCTQKKYSTLGKEGLERTDPYLSNGQGYVKYVDENGGKQEPKVFASRRRLDLGNISSSDISRLPEVGAKAAFDDLEASLHRGSRTSLTRPQKSPVVSDGISAKSLDSASLNQPLRGDQLHMRNNDRGVQDEITIPSSVATNPPHIPPLLSLADLWGERKNAQSLTLEQRLEEEKCRREHCENMVQTLQSRLLEAQQRLAVAQRVDSEKDAAIKHLHSTWTKIVDAWHGLEEERDTLAYELQAARDAFQSQKDQLTKKLAKCEDELSKALDLAHGYKEQAAAAERTRTEQLELLGEKAKEVERRLAAAKQAQQESETREQELRDRIAKETEKSADLQKALTNVKKTLSQREAEISVLTEEKGALQMRLKEERSRGDTLQQSRDTIRRESEDAGKRERALQAEVRQLTQQLSTVRSELRDFYQEQLERAVRDKLAEFQSQLDAAESALQREAENREFAMAELAARQLKQLTDKHKHEVTLLEQRHAEQMHLVQIQKTEAEKNVLELRKSLEEHETNASNLAQRLHGIMQNQWREALNVVSGPKAEKMESKPPSERSNLGGNGNRDDMSGQSWLLVKQQEQESRRRQRQKEQGPPDHYSDSHPQRTKWGGMTSNDEIPFEQEGQLTQRSSVKANQQNSNSSGDSGEDLKKYIKMLLDRAPGRPFETASPAVLPGSDSGRGGKMSDKVPASSGRDSRCSGGKPPPWK